MGKFSIPFKKKAAAPQDAPAPSVAVTSKDITSDAEDSAAEAKNNIRNIVRSILVVLAFLLILAVVIFQWLEINEYKIKDNMFERLNNLFKTTEAASPQAPADMPAETPADAPAETPAAPAAEGAEAAE